MFQEQRPLQQQKAAPRTQQPSTGNATRTSAGYKVMSESISDRRVMLGQSYYQDAKKFIGEALSLDEEGDRMKALELYNKSLSTIRSGLAILQSSVGAESGDSPALHEIRGKMERMKEQIKSRMEVLLQCEIASRSLAKSTISQSPSASVARTAGLASTARPMPTASGVREEAKADVLFNMDTGIGLFEVDQKEHVRKYNDVDALTLFKYRSKIEGQPPAFLQCGGFVYPLVPGKSPILKSGDRMYMFPELRGEDGCSVGVSLEYASEAEIAHLDQLLSQYAQLKTSEQVAAMVPEGEGAPQEVTSDITWGSSVAGGIDRGVSWVSNKITQGTEVAGNLIVKGATKLRDQIEPNEKPTEIPQSVQKGVYYTRRTTECVVGVSDFLMTSLAKLTVKVGKGVMDAVQDSEYVKSAEINPHVKETWKVTKSSLKGAAGVFSDLKKGASAVVQASGKETSRTVGHKYGKDAEQVTGDSLSAAGNTASVVYTYWSWKTWGITFLGKVGDVVTKNSREKELTDKEKQ